MDHDARKVYIDEAAEKNGQRITMLSHNVQRPVTGKTAAKSKEV